MVNWVLVAALMASLTFSLYRLEEVERQRYAMLVGLCPGTITAIDPVCVASAQPRENMWWNIYYGLSP